MMHPKISKEVIDIIHSKLPVASIALTGSVANGTYKDDSDIDILYANNNLNESYSINFCYKNFNISLFVYNKNIFYKNRINFLCNYHNMPILYILNSLEEYDSTRMIYDLKTKIKEVFEKRKILKSSIIDELKKDIIILLEIKPNDTIELKKTTYIICEKTISIFFLKKQNEGTKTKKEGYNPFSIIEKKDIKLYNILKECLPYNEHSYSIIKEAFYNYILINY